EALLFRSVLDINTWLRVSDQRWLALALLLAFSALQLALEIVLAATVRRSGRGLENRLRVNLLDKIPRLLNSYFESRPTSDMLERSHTLHTLRQLPVLGVKTLRLTVELGITAAAVAWLDPTSAVWAMLAAVAGGSLPLLANRLIGERDLRVRALTGLLAR